jgi:predicted SprT family Zn-dependent metalloprotease
MKKQKLQAVARRIKILAEGELDLILDVRIYIIDKKKMDKMDIRGTQGLYNGLNSIYICPDNIKEEELLFNGFIKTVAHELRHYWQYETGKTYRKIYKKYMNQAKRNYGLFTDDKRTIREEADAYQFENKFFKKYSRRFRRF